MQDLQSTGKRLLVAEDNNISLIVVSRMLELLGYSFDAAENGADCLKLLTENDYDLVLTDIQMPGMDGMQLAAQIRSMEDPKNAVPIIAMTANADLAEAEGFDAAGINDVLAKPFNREDLLRCIEKWV